MLNLAEQEESQSRHYSVNSRIFSTTTGDEGHLILHFRLHHPADEHFYWLVYAALEQAAFFLCNSGVGVLKKEALFLKSECSWCLGLFRFLRLPLTTPWSSLPMNISVTVSGPACIGPRGPVMSGEVYKKSSSSPAEKARLKGKKIKRYCSFSLGRDSSKDSEMHYKYR